VHFLVIYLGALRSLFRIEIINPKISPIFGNNLFGVIESVRLYTQNRSV
jgi:hypothetical protein